MIALSFAISQFLSACLLRLAFGAGATGRQHVPPRGAVLLASNHASFLDPLLVGAFTPRRCRFLARASLGRVPLVGAWMRSVGTVFVEREAPTARALQLVVELLEAGEVVSVFPEGTRTRDGRIAPFKRGILLLVKKTRATVVPVGVRGSFEAFPRGRRFPRLFRRCSVAYGEPMTADEMLSEGGLAVLEHRVAALSGYPSASAENRGRSDPGQVSVTSVSGDAATSNRSSDAGIP